MLIRKTRSATGEEVQVADEPTGPLTCSRAKILEKLSMGVGIVETEGSVSLFGVCPSNSDPLLIYSAKVRTPIEAPYDIKSRRNAGEVSIKAVHSTVLKGVGQDTDAGSERFGCQACFVGFSGVAEFKAVVEDTAAIFSSSGQTHEVDLG